MAPRQRLAEEEANLPFGKRLIKHLIKSNALYNKPNVAVLGQMTTILVTAIVVVSLVFQEYPPFWIGLVVFGIDLLIEVGIITFLGWTNQPIFNYLLFLPGVCILIELILVAVDSQKDMMNSVYGSPLLLVPFIMIFYKKSNYHLTRVNPVCLAIMFTVIEIMLLVKSFTSARLSYYSVLIVMFYYFLVTFFFNVLNLVSAIFQLIHAVGTCWKDFKWRMFTVQFCLGFDSLAALLLALILANWSYAYERLQDARTKHSELSDAIKDEAFLRAWLQRIAVGCLIYSVLRCIFLYISTMDDSGNNVRFALGNIGAPRRPLTNAEISNERNPRVVKYEAKASSFLNLFRINANYYGAGGGKVAPAGQEPEDDQCTICCEKKADCIILDCRHGGVCKACSLSMVKKSSLCPFCRNHIKRICVVKKVDDSKFQITEEIKF